MPSRAALATTALDRFWPASGELTLLGPWCSTPDNSAVRVARGATMIPTPWTPALESRAFAEFDRVHDALLAQCAERLGAHHGLKRSMRWWRIVLGPWLMAWLTTLQDRLIHAEALAGRYCETLYPDAPPPVARDTGEYLRWLSTDAMNLQLTAAALRQSAVPGSAVQAPAPTAARDGAAWEGASGAAAAWLLRGLRHALAPRVVFSSLYMSRADQARLVAATRGRAQPLLARLPPSPPVDPRSPLRRDAPAPVDSSSLARLAAETLPGHLPRLFVEGWADCRAAALAGWERPPRAALTCVGWCLDEPFKILAAETVETGGRLVIAQHGGAYGLFEVLYNERHERAVSDEWWSWGWEESSTVAMPARVRPMPNPRLAPRPPRPDHGRGILLVTHSLPRTSYTFYYCNVPLWPRYDEYLAQRDRFVSSCAREGLRDLAVRLPPEDNGWGMAERLERAAPDAILERPVEPLLIRASRAELTIVDHPQTSALELVAAGVPTILFWDPALWRMRPSAHGLLDGLREAGVLFDSPEAAARGSRTALADIRSWREDPARLRALEAFRRRYASGDSRWAELWARRLAELCVEASA